MKPNDYDKKSIIPFKSSQRKKIREMGYTTVVNIGDQFSDLASGYAFPTEQRGLGIGTWSAMGIFGGQ